MGTGSRLWFITGVSSGFGRELAKQALDRGDRVVGTLRKVEQVAAFEALAPGRAFARILDLADAATIGPIIDGVERELGPIDFLVNNAGYGLGGAVEELDDAECRHVMETNFFGTLNTIKAVIPYFRRRGSGRIINFSSMAGLMGFAGFGLYNASKFAVTGLTEALAAELAPFGIFATVVEPGGFRTNFAGGSLTLAKRAIPEYATTHAGRVRGMREHYFGTEKGDPVRAAAAVLVVADSPKPPVHFLLGPDVVAAARGKVERFTREIAEWESLSTSTNYPE